jgi:DNA-binding CsgD family transcriptional regulator
MKIGQDVIAGRQIKHFRYRKITPQIRDEMLRMKENGMTYSEIAHIYGLHPSTVIYHLDTRQHRNILNRARKLLAERRGAEKTVREKKYNTEYFKDRYHNDEEFRMKVIRANSGGRFAD